MKVVTSDIDKPLVAPSSKSFVRLLYFTDFFRYFFDPLQEFLTSFDDIIQRSLPINSPTYTTSIIYKSFIEPVPEVSGSRYNEYDLRAVIR